jgi:hypothetical protein
MSLGDSILQTASMARCVSADVTATDHITGRSRDASNHEDHEFKEIKRTWLFFVSSWFHYDVEQEVAGLAG